MIMNLVRSLFVAAVFAGLCAGIRARFDIDYRIAPFVAASGIVAILMFAGMLGILKPCLLLLYALGLAGLTYAFIVKKITPPDKISAR